MVERTEELKKRSQAPSAAQVVAYLRRHPDFLLRHPELLDLQKPPSRHAGDSSVVDFQQAMVEKLRKDVTRLRTEQDEIIANSRDNLGTQERIHKAALALLEAETFEHFIDIITSDLALLLDVDVVSLCIERAKGAAAQSAPEGLEFLAPGAVDRILGKSRQVLLRDETTGDPEIFGAGADLVRSDALLRLHPSPEAPVGLLAFGARHPGYFHHGQGTELLSFLGRIIEFAMRAWLDLERP
jgi:uncharacterized protein YigA (DUF484 family)